MGTPSGPQIKCALSTDGSVCVDICSYAVDSAPSVACYRVTGLSKLVIMDQLHVLEISEQVREGQTGLRNRVYKGSAGLGERRWVGKG